MTTHQSVSRQNLVRASVAAVLGTAAIFSYSPIGISAEAEEEVDELAEVRVTGSRIVRRDFVSNSPLVTVDTEAFESRTGLNVESYLNQLPNFNPATTPTTSQGDVQITPVNSVGISSVSLRGFGPNRNLVLVDGHRPVPINALMVTDINSIPSAMIERVEIISGGASATYGADAIGGVTNFILRDDFQGLELDLQHGVTEVGDGQETRAYALMGTDIGEGRGNLTIGAEWYERKSALEKNRSFYTDSWSDPTVGGDLFLFGYNGYNMLFAPPGAAAANAIFPNRPVYTTGPATGQQTGVWGFGSGGIFGGFRFNEDGTLFTTAGNNTNKFLQGGGVVDGVEYAYQQAYDGTIGTQGQVIDTLKWNNLEALASAPQTRYSFFGSGNYDITDSIEFFSRATFAQSKTRTLLLPTNASYGWEASIPYNPVTDSPINPALNYADPALLAAIRANPAAYANPGFIPTGTVDPDGTGPLLGAQHPVTVEMAMLLNSRANPAGSWVLETYPTDSFDQRATLNTNTVWQVETGLRMDLPFKDWTSELYFSHGESSTYNNAYGNNSLTRWRTLVTQNDYGRNVRLSGNQAPASQNPGFGAGDVTCTTGFYDMIFLGDTRPSDDCRTAVQANLQSRTENTQNAAELNLQGGLFDLPAGELRAAFGLQWRDNSASFQPDILQSTSSFTDQVIGVYPTGYLDASTSVKEVYGELLVPVVQNLPFLKKVELELGGRYSDYEDTKSTFTYKMVGNIQFNDWLRLRGGYNRATRAPNLGELFLNEQEIFLIGGANFGDPCSGRSNAPYGAGGVAPDPVITPGEPPTQLAAGQTTAGATSAYLICQAQMGALGTSTYYGPGTNAVGGGGSLFNWILQEGNPDLESEKADTWTAGLVFQSVSGNPLLSGFTASVDWWKVDISDAIQQYSIDYARFLCYGAVTVTNATEAAAQAATRECQNVGRSPASGGATTVKIAYDNQATIATSGIDVALNWGAALADMGMASLPGRLGVNVQASFTDYYKTKQSPTVFDVETDWKGSLGPNLTGTNAGAYSYRLFTSFNYALENKGVSLRWRHLPSVWSAAVASERAIIRNNEAVAGGAPGILLSYTPNTAIKAKSYDAFDLSFNWGINETLSVRGGVDNLFDVKPVTTGASRGRPYDPSLTAAENLAARNSVCSTAQQALGCVNPTAYSLASTGAGTTSAGYYDTLGRRFFLGLKARF